MTMESNSEIVKTEPESPELTVVNVNTFLDEYAALEMECVQNIVGETEQAMQEMTATIDNNKGMTSKEYIENLENAVEIITVRNLMVQDAIQTRTAKHDKLKDQLSKLPPPESIEELRKEKQDLILNHSKIVQDAVDKERKERKKKMEAEEEIELAKINKQIEIIKKLIQVEKVNQLNEELTEEDNDDTDIEPNDSLKGSQDDEDIEVVTEHVTVSQSKKWEKELCGRLREIERVKAVTNTTEDQVERLKIRLKDLDEQTSHLPSTSKCDDPHVPLKKEPKAEKSTTPEKATSHKLGSSKSTPRRRRSKRGVQSGSKSARVSTRSSTSSSGTTNVVELSD